MDDMITSCKTGKKDGIAQKKTRDLLVSAYVLEPLPLSLYTSIQNVVWYAVECLNSLPSSSGKNGRCSEHFFKCLSHLETLMQENPDTLDERVRKLLTQFIGEAEKVKTVLVGFFDRARFSPVNDEALIPQSAGSQIVAKATYLQWIAVCLSEEMKMPVSQFSRS
jgi:hypothetical protein